MLNFSVNKIGSSLLIARNVIHRLVGFTYLFIFSFIELQVTSNFRARGSTTSFSSLLSARLPTTSVVRMKSTEQNDLLRSIENKKRHESVCFSTKFSFPFIRLPVPNVAETAQKYLATVTPLLNREEFYETAKVRKFFFSSQKFNVKFSI